MAKKKSVKASKSKAKKISKPKKPPMLPIHCKPNGGRSLGQKPKGMSTLQFLIEKGVIPMPEANSNILIVTDRTS